MPVSKSSTGTQTVSIQALDRRKARVTIIGQTPLIVNKMSNKARNTLLLGGRKKTAAERLEIKHHPFDEFKDAMYIDLDFHPESAVKFPVVAFKSAMGTAALVTSGMKKTDVNRLVYIPDEYCPIFGIPRLRMDIVRSSDMARTPDVRTRATFLQWATQFDLEFIAPALSLHSVTVLLNNAGLVSGVGENRQEKGKGSFGTFGVGDDIPKDLLGIKDSQIFSFDSPTPVDDESAALLQEYADALAKAA